MHLIEKNISFTACAMVKVYKSDWHFSRGLLGGGLGGVGWGVEEGTGSESHCRQIGELQS